MPAEQDGECWSTTPTWIEEIRGGRGQRRRPNFADMKKQRKAAMIEQGMLTRNPTFIYFPSPRAIPS